MNNNWYLQERLANYQQAELLQEAARARMVKLARGDSRPDGVLLRLFNWLGKIARAQLPAGQGSRQALERLQLSPCADEVTPCS
jgi:hypothetical protein